MASIRTVYTDIHFIRRSADAWLCGNAADGEVIGEIWWHPPLGKWCFSPAARTIYTKGCLANIAHFISQISVGIFAAEKGE